MKLLPELSADERRRLLWLTAAAALLRLWNLGAHEFGMVDTLRLVSATAESGTLGEQAAIIHIGSVGGVLLLRAMAALSDAWWWLRLPYALIGTLNVALFFLFVRRFFGARLALVAGWLLCLAPFHLALSGSLEEHEFTVFFALLGTWLGFLLIEDESDAARLAPWLGAIEALGLLIGGYLILGYWSVLAALVLARIGKKLGARDWAILTAAQLPMLALFGWLLSYGVFAEDPGAYVEWIRRMTWPRLPSSPAAVVTDLLVHAESWVWTPRGHLGVIAAEVILSAGAVALAWLGYRLLRKESQLAAPVLGLCVGVPALMGLIYFSFFGKPWYFARAYATASIPFYLLIASGLIAASRVQRLAAAVLYLPPVLLSLAMMWTGFHPVHLSWEGRILDAAAQHVAPGETVYVHPGELAALMRPSARTDSPPLRGVWRDPELTPEGWRDVLTPMRGREFAAAANEIATAHACLIELHWIEWRDPHRELRSLLERQYGYKLVSSFWSIAHLYCPGEAR